MLLRIWQGHIVVYGLAIWSTTRAAEYSFISFSRNLYIAALSYSLNLSIYYDVLYDLCDPYTKTTQQGYIIILQELCSMPPFFLLIKFVDADI